MTRLILPAPAKLNLFLHVTGRRDDGYHTLESLLVPLDLCDVVTLAAREDESVARTCEVPGVAEAADLAVRAARLLQRATGCARGVDLAVEKRIPIGGGLGGGSSDAATVLLGLNRLWGLGLSRDDLARVALSLGADVPFFVRGEPALARGIGDVLTPCSVPRDWVALIAPPVTVPTAAMFAAPELTRATPSAKMDVFSVAYGRNDLQPVALARYPAIGVALAALARHSTAARMSGSGGCVYACFRSYAEANAAIVSALEAAPGSRGFVTRILAQHPLFAFA